MGLGESIIFTGKVSQERLADVFFDLDLSVTTHRNEGFGLVHLESLATGTPVVAYNEGGQVDFLREAGGALVDGGPAEFAREVANLLRDHQRRSAMGIDGYRLVARSYSTEIMAKSYEKLFRDLLGQ
jgi:glycosyltransferase involved in cell wall biosynthesis